MKPKTTIRFAAALMFGFSLGTIPALADGMNKGLMDKKVIHADTAQSSASGTGIVLLLAAVMVATITSD